MEDRFDILEYLSGLTSFVFDKAVLKRIALDRGVMSVTSYSELDDKTKDLLRADLLLAAYLSPNVWASYTQSHGSYSQTTGSQTIDIEEKERIYNMLRKIYSKYDDAKLEEIGEEYTMDFLDI